MTSEKSLPLSGRIPFRQSADHLMIVKGYINQTGPFNFIVDTGASMTIVSTAAAKAAGLNSSGRKATAQAAKGTMAARIVRLKSLTLGLVETKILDAAILDLRDLNTKVKTRVDGIIGYNLLKRYRLTIDFKSHSMWLTTPSSG